MCKTFVNAVADILNKCHTTFITELASIAGKHTSIKLKMNICFMQLDLLIENQETNTDWSCVCGGGGGKFFRMFSYS